MNLKKKFQAKWHALENLVNKNAVKVPKEPLLYRFTKTETEPITDTH